MKSSPLLHPLSWPRSREARDVAWVLGITAALFIVLSATEAFEAFYAFSRAHESWDLDELVLVFPLAAVGLAWLAWRRLGDVRKEAALREERERDLEEARDRLNEAEVQARLGHWQCDPRNPRVGIWSDTVYSLLGIKPGDATPGSAALIASVCASDRTTFLRAYEDLTEGRGSIKRDLRIRHPDGRTVHVHVEAKLRSGGNNVLPRVVGTIQDISLRKAYEEELLRLKKRYENILMTAGEGIIGLDSADRVSFCNPAAARITGWKAEEMVGRSREEVLFGRAEGGDDPDPNACPLFTAVADADMDLKGDEIFWRKDGNCFPVEYASTQMAEPGSGDAPGVVVVFRDITRRIEFEAELARRSRALTASNEELQQFAYVVSHDLQEPLRMVTSYVQLLEHRLEPVLTEDMRECMGFAVEGAQRMSQLLRALLEYSRVESRGDRLTRVETKTALDGALLNLQLAIVEIEAEITIEGDLPPVLGDESQLVRVFQNLVGNALKYHEPSRTPEIRISARRGRGGWIFSVADNGIGFEPEYQERIFRIFQRLHSRGDYEGTGIGLAIVKRIVERHGGRVWAEGRPGEGSTFRFTLQDTSAASRWQNGNEKVA